MSCIMEKKRSYLQSSNLNNTKKLIRFNYELAFCFNTSIFTNYIEEQNIILIFLHQEA